MKQTFLKQFPAFTHLTINFFLSLLLVTTLQMHAAAQKSTAFNVEKLAVSFSIVNNNYQNKNQALAKFVLTNNGLIDFLCRASVPQTRSMVRAICMMEFRRR